MFSGRYAEGQALSSITPPDINLVGPSNTNTVRILLKLVHLSHKDLPRSLDVETLLDLVGIANQYDCISAIRPVHKMWMFRARQTEPGYFGFLGLIETAFVLSDREDFRHWTGTFVMQNDERFTDAQLLHVPSDTMRRSITGNLSTTLG